MSQGVSTCENPYAQLQSGAGKHEQLPDLCRISEHGQTVLPGLRNIQASGTCMVSIQLVSAGYHQLSEGKRISRAVLARHQAAAAAATAT